MAEWIECKISDIGTVVGGATPSTKKPENYENGTIAWITPKDLSTFSGRYIQHGERNITEAGLRSCSTQLLPKNTVLFSSRAPIGYVAIAANDVCTNQGFKSVIPNENTNPLFLYYLLKYNKDKIEGMGSGTTFKEVSGNTMKNIVVSVPTDKKVQERISSMLGSIDDKIEENERINNNLEEQAQLLFTERFVTNDYSVDQEAKLGDICKCILGGTPNRAKAEYWGGTIPWINSGEINQFRIISPSELITQAGLDHSTTKMLPAKTTVLAITGATLGQVSLLEIDACANQSVVGIIPNDTLPYEFIYPFIKAKSNELISHQTGGAQQHINKQNVESLPVSIPTKAILDDFVTLVSPMYSMIASNCFENMRLENMRDSLLPQLMSGELDVSDLEL